MKVTTGKPVYHELNLGEFRYDTSKEKPQHIRSLYCADVLDVSRRQKLSTIRHETGNFCKGYSGRILQYRFQISFARVAMMAVPLHLC